MSLLTGKPPYTDLEVERIARALARREAWGCWFSDPRNPAPRVFEVPLRRVGAAGYLAILEQGGLFAFGLREGKKFLPNDLPKFTEIAWLDAAFAGRVLKRAREHEATAGRLGLPSPEAIDDQVARYDAGRLEALPGLRAAVAKAGDRARGRGL